MGRQLPQPLDPLLEPKLQEQEQNKIPTHSKSLEPKENEHLYKSTTPEKKGIRASQSEERREEQLMWPLLQTIRSQNTRDSTCANCALIPYVLCAAIWYDRK
jgi:hypothetical protein